VSSFVRSIDGVHKRHFFCRNCHRFLSAVTIVLIVLCVWEARSMELRSSWDERMPDITITDVNVHELTLTESWQAFSFEYGLRAILYYDHTVQVNKPFSFARDSCLVRDLFDAFALEYGLTWKADPVTSVHWFFPTDQAYEDILPAKVALSSNQHGLPMHSGVLTALLTAMHRGELGRDGNELPVSIHLGGELFGRSMDFAMDIPGGTHSIRDIVNFCCVANPKATFVVSGETGLYITIVPINLIVSSAPTPTAGALEYWRSAIGPFEGAAPSQAQVLRKLADDSARVRRAARHYLVCARLGPGKWAYNELEDEEAVWLSLALLNVYVRIDGLPHDDLSLPLRSRATPQFLASCREDLAVLAALELARLFDDTSGLKQVSQRKISKAVSDELTSEVAYLARISDRVWEALGKAENGIAGAASEWVKKITEGAPRPEREPLFTFPSPRRD
jgi:hypothetical protein